MTNQELETKITELAKKQEDSKLLMDSSTKENKMLREELDTLKIQIRDKIKYENIYGSLITSVSDASAGTETTHAHNLPSKPKMVFITSKGNGTVYLSSATDSSNIYIKASANSIDFEAYCII